MSDVFVLGLSHRSAPVALRERVAVPSGDLAVAVRALASEAGLDEALLVSTCNRVELYGVASGAGGVERARHALEARAGGADLAAHLYARRGADAVRHAFRVAASLDSMVVGEPQILGQIKEAFAVAGDAGVLGGMLERCFAKAFAVAKRVRSETGIAAGAVSVSSIACELARSIFGELAGKRVLLVGAGKMGEKAAKQLAGEGARIFVLNRSRERAHELAAACGGEPRSLAELPSELALADVVIASTSSDRFVVTVELMRDVVRARKYRPLFLIDIAVPRDVDPRVGEMEGVFLYDVDDLSKVAADNLAARRREADAAERIVAVEVEAFEVWRRQQALKPLIVGLREHVRATLAAEIERTLPRLDGDLEKNRAALARMTDAATNKLLHHALTELKQAGERGDAATLATAARLFPGAISAHEAPGPRAALRTERDAPPLASGEPSKG